jgi:ADP-ribose pyrophosphatase YjhB (NUDIX family)
MTVGDRTRSEVRRRIQRLRDRYGDFPVRETTVENDPDYFETGVELATEGWVGDAGAFVTDEEGRALLIRHEESPDRWGTPGGGHEPGETLEATARREVREETGVDCSLVGVALARHKTVRHAEDPDRELHLLTVEFAAEYEGGDRSVGDEEVLEARWFETLPDLDPLVADAIGAWRGE